MPGSHCVSKDASLVLLLPLFRWTTWATLWHQLWVKDSLGTQVVERREEVGKLRSSHVTRTTSLKCYLRHLSWKAQAVKWTARRQLETHYEGHVHLCWRASKHLWEETRTRGESATIVSRKQRAQWLVTPFGEAQRHLSCEQTCTVCWLLRSKIWWRDCWDSSFSNAAHLC